MSKTYSVPCIYPKLKRDSATAPLVVEVPGSKSITNRALLLATLAEGESILRNVLFSDDSRHFLKCIQDLGFKTTVNEEQRIVTVTGLGGKVPRKDACQYVGSAGTAARFLTAYLGVSKGTYYMDASEQMRKRPMAPLLDSLKELGCEILHDTTDSKEGYFPFTLRSHGFNKDNISINIDHSSQFLSALLIASCLSEKDFTIHVQGSHGMAYIEMTRRMMAQFGVEAEVSRDYAYITKAGQSYQARDYYIEPDVSAACYFYGMVPLLHIPVMVKHVHFDSLQGDVEFIRILEQMGCTPEDTPEGIVLYPPAAEEFPGVHVNMSACSDQAITLAAIAPFASSPTRISGIAHIRHQESDRISAICTELKRMGIRAEDCQDEILIHPGIPEAAEVTTYDDHRIAMGFSLIGLRAEGIIIDDPDCCRKTFENYFQVLDSIIAQLNNNM